MNDGLADDRWSTAADLLVRQRRALAPIGPLPASVRPRTVADGYALQRAVSQRLAAAGLGPVVGHKIGCTTDVMQRFLGIGHPCAGRVHAQGLRRRTARVPRHRFVKLGIECEIAVVLGDDLGSPDGPCDRDRAAAAVQAVMAAIEVVDDRYRDFEALGVPTLVGDDFFQSGCVLGDPVADWRHLDLAALSGSMELDGERVGSGTGASVMGHPLNALAWLADARIADGSGPLRRGEFVLLGSVVATRWLDAGTQARIEIDGLGSVRLDVAP